jgi:hypothetical protein
LFNSILAGIGVFIGGFAFGHWVTSTLPSIIGSPSKRGRPSRT